MNRLEVLARIDELTDQHCLPCPDRPKNDERLSKCYDCPVYSEYRKCGDQLDELIKKKRGVVEMPTVEQYECTKENYQKLRDEGKKMNEVADHLGVSIATLYKYKNKWFSRDYDSAEAESDADDEPSQDQVMVEAESSKTEFEIKPEVNSDVKSKYIDQISNLNKRLTYQNEEHQKLIRNYEELSQQYAAAVKDKDEAVKQLNELQASSIDGDTLRRVLRTLLEG